MELERWKNILGYETHYQVSSFGRVKRLAGFKAKNERVLVLKKKPNGYLFVCLCVKNKLKYFHVHRLVAGAFIKNKENKPQINHKDCNKENNYVSNLEWVTPKENNNHARKNIVFNFCAKRGIDVSQTKQLVQFDLDLNPIFYWESAEKASKFYNVSITCIGIACRRGTPSIGYKWGYIPRDEYYAKKELFLDIPKNYVNKRTRDTTKAHTSRKNRLDNITFEYHLKNGVDCFKKHGNIYRENWELYARENKTMGYGAVVTKFGTFNAFQNQVIELIKGQINNPQ